MKSLHKVSFILLVIGGLNWGLVGLGWLMGNPGGWNVVHMLLGSWPTLEALVYLLVGISAVLILFGHKKDCRACNPSGMTSGPAM